MGLSARCTGFASPDFGDLGLRSEPEILIAVILILGSGEFDPVFKNKQKYKKRKTKTVSKHALSFPQWFVKRTVRARVLPACVYVCARAIG